MTRSWGEPEEVERKPRAVVPCKGRGFSKREPPSPSPNFRPPCLFSPAAHVASQLLGLLHMASLAGDQGGYCHHPRASQLGRCSHHNGHLSSLLRASLPCSLTIPTALGPDLKLKGLFYSGGRRQKGLVSLHQMAKVIGVSASASVFPMNIQD